MAAHVRTVAVPDADRRELQRRVRDKGAPAREVERARIVLLAAEGVPGKQIAAIVGCAEPTVVTWRGRYAESGLAGLADLPRPGKPAQLPEALRERVLELTLTEPPTSVGATHWSSRLLATAPAELREQLRSTSLAELVRIAGRWRTGGTPDTHLLVTKHALRSLARRHQDLTEEIRDLDAQLARLVRQAAPQLLAVKGLGPLTCAALLVAVGDHPERMRTESAFAHLCGVAPLPASSGKTSRHRLNRGGDRQANYALYILAVTRMAWDPGTRAYVARRQADGKTTKEIIRCLKRHIAREIYRLLTTPAAATPQTT
jgi:transposase